MLQFLPSSKAPGMTSGEIRRSQDQVGQLNVRLEKAERELAEAKGEAHEARERVLEMRDQVVAAQRDQQDLRTARAASPLCGARVHCTALQSGVITLARW
jgi:hypothetical protein